MLAMGLECLLLAFLRLSIFSFPLVRFTLSVLTSGLLHTFGIVSNLLGDAIVLTTGLKVS